MFLPLHTGPYVTIRPSDCAVVAFFLYTLNNLEFLYFTYNWCVLTYNTRYYTWGKNNKIPSKMHKQLVQQKVQQNMQQKVQQKVQQKKQQKVHNNYVSPLIK